MESRNFEMSYFNPPITNKTPSRTLTLAEVAAMIKSDLLAPQTRHLRSISDKAEARGYKGHSLPYVTPSGVFGYCNDQSLIRHSGVLCVDLDHLKDVDCTRRQLIGDRHFVTPLAFRSPSGDGLKWFLLIDLSVCDHRTWFHAVRNYLLANYELTEKQVDSQCQNLSRACFLCYDPTAYVNLGVKETEQPFDPTAWAGRTATASHPIVTAKRQPCACQSLHPVEELAKAKAVTRELLRRGANIAETYGDYLKLGFALANGLGSDGRELYHQLCRQSTKYREDDCERKWQQCVRQSDGRTTIATFYNMAKQAGVDLSGIAREFKPESIYNF